MFPTSTVTSSYELWNAIASTSGQFVQQSVPFWYIYLATLLALFVIGMIIWAFKDAFSRAIFGRKYKGR